MASTYSELSENDLLTIDHCDDYDNHVLTPKTKAHLLKQVEFYFSDANLPTDKKLLKQIRKDPEGYVPVKLFSNFRKVRAITKDPIRIAEALKSSSFLVLDEQAQRVRRQTPLPQFDAQSIKRKTILVENLQPCPTIESITKLFSGYGKVKLVRICSKESKGRLPSWLTNACQNPSQQHAYVEFESEEAAIMATGAWCEPDDTYPSLQVQLVSSITKPITTSRRNTQDTEPVKDGTSKLVIPRSSHSSAGGGRESYSISSPSYLPEFGSFSSHYDLSSDAVFGHRSEAPSSPLEDFVQSFSSTSYQGMPSLHVQLVSDQEISHRTSTTSPSAPGMHLFVEPEQDAPPGLFNTVNAPAMHLLPTVSEEHLPQLGRRRGLTGPVELTTLQIDSLMQQIVGTPRLNSFSEGGVLSETKPGTFTGQKFVAADEPNRCPRAPKFCLDMSKHPLPSAYPKPRNAEIGNAKQGTATTNSQPKTTQSALKKSAAVPVPKQASASAANGKNDVAGIINKILTTSIGPPRKPSSTSVPNSAANLLDPPTLSVPLPPTTLPRSNSTPIPSSNLQVPSLPSTHVPQQHSHINAAPQKASTLMPVASVLLQQEAIGLPSGVQPASITPRPSALGNPALSQVRPSIIPSSPIITHIPAPVEPVLMQPPTLALLTPPPQQQQSHTISSISSHPITDLSPAESPQDPTLVSTPTLLPTTHATECPRIPPLYSCLISPPEGVFSHSTPAQRLFPMQRAASDGGLLRPLPQDMDESSEDEKANVGVLDLASYVPKRRRRRRGSRGGRNHRPSVDDEASAPHHLAPRPYIPPPAKSPYINPLLELPRHPLIHQADDCLYSHSHDQFSNKSAALARIQESLPARSHTVPGKAPERSVHRRSSHVEHVHIALGPSQPGAKGFARRRTMISPTKE